MTNGFGSLLPPLSSDEQAALRADIKKNGVLVPIIVDENDEILDGRHRYEIEKNAPRRVISGLSEGEKEAFVFRANFVRRNLSPTEKAYTLKKMRLTAKKLREENTRKWTQKRIAEELGVSRECVSAWFNRSNASNGTSTNTCPHLDSRVKINPAAKPKIVELVTSGVSQAQVAADFGVSRQQISTIVRAEQKKQAAKEERTKAAEKLEGDCGIIHGSIEEAGAQIQSESVDLVFTDPPYDEESSSLYGSLASLSVRILRPGGWLVAYSGNFHLPQVLQQMQVEPLVYAWTFCVLHSGGDTRIRKYKLRNGWKPLVAFYKPPLSVTWEWFRDVVSGGKEKELHEWQQAESEASHFIQQLSCKGSFVCDPFCGAGTTLSAAKQLGRRWLGVDKNEEHVLSARIRLSD